METQQMKNSQVVTTLIFLTDYGKNTRYFR
jgi:hypothetical protein